MTKTLPMSRFIQNYSQHLADAEQSDGMLLLQQRAGRPSWVLATEPRVHAFTEATDFLSAALSTLVHDESLVAGFVAGLPSTLPWVQFLPPEDRENFAIEAADTLRACASIGRYTAFAELIEDWRNTAEIWSDPALATSLQTEIAEPLNVPVDQPVS